MFKSVTDTSAPSSNIRLRNVNASSDFSFVCFHSRCRCLAPFPSRAYSIQRHSPRQRGQEGLLLPILYREGKFTSAPFSKKPCDFLVPSCAERYLMRRHSARVKRSFGCNCVDGGWVFCNNAFYFFKITIKPTGRQI